LRRFQLELLSDEFGLLEERSIEGVPSCFVEDFDIVDATIFLFPDGVVRVWFEQEDSSCFYVATEEFKEFFKDSDGDMFYVTSDTPEIEQKRFDYLNSLL
jgi:hypothetical protein